jgi:hypothetical protein
MNLGFGRTARVRVVLATLAGGLVVGSVAAFGSTGGHPAKDVHLLSGAAWLASPRVGQVTLLDGSSAEVAAQVQVAPAGDAIDVVQRGSTAYAIDQTAGTIRRVDGATFEPGDPASPLPGASGGLTAFAGTDAVFVLDTRRGVLVNADPHTLAPRGDTVPLSALPDADSATLDGSDRLWVIDHDTGELVRVSGSTRTKHQVDGAKHAVLTVAGGNPVLVDVADRKVTTINPALGTADASLPVDLRADDQLRVSGSAHADRLYLVANRGVLLICELSARSCDQPVPLDENSKLGAAVEAGNRLFVPDFSSGRVLVIDLTRHTLLDRAQVLTTPGQFQLLSRDGVVFFNDLNSERAGVIKLDGTVVTAAKYDPKNPAKGLDTQGQNDNAPPEQNPQPNPAPNPDPNPQPQPNPNPQPQPQPNPNPNPQPQPNPPPPPPPDNPPPNNPPPKQWHLNITVSKTKPVVNEDVSLKVTGDDNTEPAKATWDFNDGTPAGSGALVTHHWTAVRTYQVSVQATMPDGQQLTTSLPIEVTKPPSVTVPDVVGKAEAYAKTAMQNVGLTLAVTKVASHTVDPGLVISQNPAGNAQAPPGSQVAVTVSTGPPAPFDFIAKAANALWQSGAGTLPFPGNDGDDRGFAVLRHGAYQLSDGTNCTLEDGTAPTYLETHPQWVDNGFITGTYTLGRAVIAGDHFRAKVGFIRCAVLVGDVTFTVQAIMPNGSAVTVATVHDNAQDGVMPPIDVDLTPQAGATKIRLRVDAGATAAQDWATWVAPRIEG